MIEEAEARASLEEVDLGDPVLLFRREIGRAARFAPSVAHECEEGTAASVECESDEKARKEDAIFCDGARYRDARRGNEAQPNDVEP